MYHLIIVPLDGSPLSEYALPIACDLARRSGAMLHLVHVHGRDTPTPIYVEGLPVIDDTLRSLGETHAYAYLERIRDRLAHEPFPTTVAVLDPAHYAAPNQSVPATLVAHAAAAGADLIVMTTHGRGGLARFWLGSVADALVRASPVPILSLRPGEPVPPAEDAPVFRRILIPLDGSARAEAILEPALAFGELAQAEYTLLRVVEPYVVDGYPPAGRVIRLYAQATEQAVAEARRYLQRLARRLRSKGHHVHTRTRLGQDRAGVILAEARKRRADIIAMATDGRSGLDRLLAGSVADSVRRGADVPVLLYRPQVVDEPTSRRRPLGLADIARGMVSMEAMSAGNR